MLDSERPRAPVRRGKRPEHRGGRGAVRPRQIVPNQEISVTENVPGGLGAPGRVTSCHFLLLEPSNPGRPGRTVNAEVTPARYKGKRWQQGGWTQINVESETKERL